MTLDKVNLAKKLAVHKKTFSSEEIILKQVKDILDKHQKNVQEISKTLASSKKIISNDFNFELLETDNIFHIDSIKSVCIDYRLRFLDSMFFKNPIPSEAINAIKALEKSHKIKIEGYKIMAPSKMFKLKNLDDPLLFAPIGNDYYYLIHKWGNDLNRFRKYAVFPLKNLSTILLTTLLISFLTTIILPTHKFGSENINMVKFISFLFIFKSYCAILLYYFFWKGKNFNSQIWNNIYSNY